MTGTFKIDRVVDRLMIHIENDEIIDVGKGAEKAFTFDVSQSTLNRAIRDMVNEKQALLFYIPVVQKSTSNKRLIKVLSPVNWTFAKVLTNIGDLVTLKKPVPFTNREMIEIGKAANKMKAEGATVEERIKATREKVDIREGNIKKALQMHAEGMSIVSIAAKMDLHESTVRNYIENGAQRATLHTVSNVAIRMRELKRNGYSNVAIGKVFGVTESTVRRRLKTPLPDEEQFLADLMRELEDARENIMIDVTNNPLFEKFFGEGRGDQWILTVNTTKRRAGFTMHGDKGQRMTFALEFSAYRRNT